MFDIHPLGTRGKRKVKLLHIFNNKGRSPSENLSYVLCCAPVLQHIHTHTEMLQISSARNVGRGRVLTGVTVLVNKSIAATDAVGVGSRLQQGEELLVTLALVQPTVRVHLTTLIKRVQAQLGAIHATSDLNKVVGGVGIVVGGKDEAGRSDQVVSVVGVFGGGTIRAEAVRVGASLIGGDLLDTVRGQHCAEASISVNLGNVVETDWGTSGACNWLQCESRSSEGSESESGLPEHCDNMYVM